MDSNEFLLPYNALYRILDFDFEIKSDSKDILDAFNRSYISFRNNGESNQLSSFHFVTCKSPEEPFVLYNGEKYRLPLSENIAVYAVSFIMRKAIESVHKYFLIHGGAVERDGVGIVFSGNPSQGKTTLVLKLVEKGFNFLSDEYAPLSRKKGTISPFPQSVGVEDEALKMFWKEMFNESEKGLRNDLRGNSKWMVDVDNIFDGEIDGEYQLKYLFILSEAGSQKKDSDIVEVAFLENKEAFVEAITMFNGVIPVSEGNIDNYSFIRYSVPKKKEIINTFHEICEKFKKNVIYTEKVSESKPVFFEKTAITPAIPSSFCIEMIENIRNFSHGSVLFDEFEGKYSSVIFEIAGLLKGVNCFYLKPGTPDDTADRIIDIIS